MRLALTFDAEHPDRPRCPPGAQEAVLDALDTAGVAATFFLQGRWAQAYPTVARRIRESGYLVGNHSHYHTRMPLLSDAGLEADVHDAERAIREATGADPRPWFRCPWGLGAEDPRVLGVLRARGYRHAGWDVVAEDWEEDRTAKDVEESVLDGLEAFGDAAVVLLHTWPGPTAEALPRILRRLRQAGTELVTLADLPLERIDATRNPLRVPREG